MAARLETMKRAIRIAKARPGSTDAEVNAMLEKKYRRDAADARGSAVGRFTKE